NFEVVNQANEAACIAAPEALAQPTLDRYEETGVVEAAGRRWLSNACASATIWRREADADRSARRGVEPSVDCAGVGKVEIGAPQLALECDESLSNFQVNAALELVWRIPRRQLKRARQGEEELTGFPVAVSHQRAVSRDRDEARLADTVRALDCRM